ncbi:hypothetical protein PPTG_00120 [Phytophthora nicotianae INRA-310]|uniref:Serine-threonine/tyrosine-protein kinase catalytic domain-containing protein n=1 Tax=Phytophthora nicotianae (strain INRA-310) TaxID=761204 RepID=W2RG64_PHYN3|nr:hypothetical protein PPTG_00120 [Phytophthora nicotianae INRA-310]ETN23540.1 hypothetical protein PPTG_00120 [Phytophthora nicotianae INRA-310]
MRRIIDDGLRPQLSPDCPLSITHLIAACVSRNPKLRPSAADSEFNYGKKKSSINVITELST